MYAVLTTLILAILGACSSQLLAGESVVVKAAKDLPKLVSAPTEVIFIACGADTVDQLQPNLLKKVENATIQEVDEAVAYSLLSQLTRDCPQLKYLVLRAQTISPKIFGAIIACQSLESIDLRGCTVANEVSGLSWPKYGKLSALGIHYTAISESALRKLVCVSSLTSITFELMESQESLTDGVMQSLAKAALGLTSVQIPYGRALTRSTLEYLGKMQHIERLRLPCNAAMTDSDAVLLSRCKSLAELDVSGCKWMLESGIAQLPQVERLNIDGTTHYSIEKLCGTSPQLRSLSLRHSKYIDEELSWLSRLTSLEVLDLSGNKLATGEFLRGLEKSTLRVLRMDHCDRLTANALKHIGKLSALEVLGIASFAGIAEADVGALSGCGKLTELNLDWCSTLTGKQLRWICENMQNLTELSIVGCSALKDDDIKLAREALGGVVRTAAASPG